MGNITSVITAGYSHNLGILHTTSQQHLRSILQCPTARLVCPYNSHRRLWYIALQPHTAVLTYRLQVADIAAFWLIMCSNQHQPLVSYLTMSPGTLQSLLQCLCCNILLGFQTSFLQVCIPIILLGFQTSFLQVCIPILKLVMFILSSTLFFLIFCLRVMRGNLNIDLVFV